MDRDMALACSGGGCLVVHTSEANLIAALKEGFRESGKEGLEFQARAGVVEPYPPITGGC